MVYIVGWVLFVSESGLKKTMLTLCAVSLAEETSRSRLKSAMSAAKGAESQEPLLMLACATVLQSVWLMLYHFHCAVAATGPLR